MKTAASSNQVSRMMQLKPVATFRKKKQQQQKALFQGAVILDFLGDLRGSGSMREFLYSTSSRDS